MHHPSLTPTADPCAEADNARRGNAAALATALSEARADTLATFAVFERSLGGLRVPYLETINPPLWELGHIGWFQEYWLARNPQRNAGIDADPAVERTAGVRSQADALYDSGRVAHVTRWSLQLPDAEGTKADLVAQLAGTLALLGDARENDASLYFFRLALMHEDMHHEAALYMARGLGLAIDDPRWQPAPLRAAREQLVLDAGPWRLGSGRADGFAFDNELSAHAVRLPRTEIDSRVLSWREYLPFVEEGGYQQLKWWSGAGAAWLEADRPQAPRYLRLDAPRWLEWWQSQWQTLDLDQAARHLTAFEAEAWCRWAGRRLPTEAEWERAAVSRPDDFEWGQVWEWTASAFEPYPGFSPHPYRDYSAPWFGSRVALRGASFMTQSRLRHPRYRNFFEPQRSDLAAGFRTCRR